VPGRDPFDFDSGGFTTDYSGTITAVTFTPDQRGQNLEAAITTKYDTPFPKDDGTLAVDRTERFIKVGSLDQWEAIDDGTGFRHVSGDPDKRVRDNSGYGTLIAKVVELVGRDALLAEGRDAPYTEKFWLGLRFHWGEVPGKAYKEFTDGEGKVVPAGTGKPKPMPDQYLGANASSNGHVGADFDIESLGLSLTTIEELGRLAEAADTPGEFSSKALTYVLTLTSPDQAVEKDNATKALSKAPQMYEALRS
jgi:hypothetical protein